MTWRADVAVLIVACAILLFILRMVRRGHLRAKYSMLWIFVGVGVAALAVFPDILTWVSDAIGIVYPPATFLLFAVAFLIMLALHFSWELSRLEDRTRALAEEVALLAERLDAAAGITSTDVEEPMP